jgi:ketosteroid isomerase-like protein
VKAVAEKGKAWMENHEVHSSRVEGPWPNGDKFIVRFSYDVTNKPSGRRFAMEEAALFTVAGGKIVREEFFYAMG